MHKDTIHFSKTPDTIADAAAKIRLHARHMEDNAVLIGEIVDEAIRLPDGARTANRLNWLARQAKIQARKLGHCHEAYLVALLAGLAPNDGPAILSFNLLRQLSRILLADGTVAWMQAAIRGVLSAVTTGEDSGRGAGHLVDRVLAGHPPRKTALAQSPYVYKPMSILADEIHGWLAAQKKAA